jgi:hypothetical protein
METLAAQATSQIPPWAFILLLVVMVLWGSFLADPRQAQAEK